MTAAASIPDQCTNRQVSHGANTAIVSSSRPTSRSDNDPVSAVAAPVAAVGVDVAGPTPLNALAPTTKTTTMTTLQNTNATTISIQRRVQTRVWSQTEPANASGAKTTTRSSAALRNSRTAHISRNPTIIASPSTICRTGPACGPASQVSARNRDAAPVTVVPAEPATNAQISSAAVSAV